MDALNAVGHFYYVSEEMARKLSPKDLLETYNLARDCGAQLELMGTVEEDTARSNTKILGDEVLRRLETVKVN